MPNTLLPRVRLGGYEFHLKTGELSGGGQIVRLAEKPFRVLLILVEGGGELVTREEIQKKLWPGDTVVDFEHGINTAIKVLRRALGDSAEDPKYIETIPRRGYRLMVPVERVYSAAGDTSGTGVGSSSHDGTGVQLQLEPTGLTGKTVSHYRVLEVVGGGGMGVVYRAEDLKLGRPVALKFLPDEVVNDRQALERFEREARAASSLDHPNICPIYEFGEHEGRPFIVMQLLQGQTLRDCLASGTLKDAASGGQVSLDRALDIAIQIADGLEAAHEQGIVHRDIKPANIFITTKDVAKILDFGLAKLFQPSGGQAITAEIDGEPGLLSPASASLDAVTLSRSGIVIGTAAYMSPEQARGLPLDARTDLFSFGLILYEMATGQRAFTGDNGAALQDAILNRAPTPPAELNSELPPELQDVIQKCLEKDRNLRYQSAAEVRSDLEKINHRREQPVLSRSEPLAVGVGREGQRAAGSAAKKRKAIPKLTIMAGVLVVLATVSFAWFLHSHRAKNYAVAPVKGRRSIAVLGFKNLSGRPDAAWLSTALSEMLITELAAGEKLRTIPGENIARMKADLELPDTDSLAQDTLTKIYQRLGSDLVVGGSYLDMGQQLRVDLHVQDATTGEMLATVSKTGSEEQLNDLVSRAGSELRAKCGVGEITPAESAEVRAAVPSNPEAARFYAEGLAKLRVFDNQAARDLLGKAVAIDPNSALAHSALAEAWENLSYDKEAKGEAKKAFDMSGDLSREQRLLIEGRYREAFNEPDKAVAVYRALFTSFPDNLEYGLHLANAQAKYKPKEALDTLEQLRKLPSPAGQDPRIDLIEADAQIQRGDPKNGQAAAARAESKGTALGARLIVAQAKAAEGWALYRAGEIEQALPLLENAKAMYAEVGDKGAVCNWLNVLAQVYLVHGDVAQAKRNLQETVKISREIGSYGLAQAAWNVTGNVDLIEGDLVGAKAAYSETLAVARSVKDKDGVAFSLSQLAYVWFFQGDLAQAKHQIEEALAIFKDADNKAMRADLIGRLGDISFAEGDLTGARKQYTESLKILDEIGERTYSAYYLIKLARVSVEEGHPADAETTIRKIPAEQLQEGELRYGKVDADVVLAQALVAQGRNTDAYKTLEESENVNGMTKQNSYPSNIGFAIETARVRAALGKNAEAKSSLETALAEATKYGLGGDQLEARLGLGEIEMKSGQTAVGRAHLKALAKDARAKGFLLIARKATAAAASGSA